MKINNLYDYIGEEKIKEISQRFYDHVYSDEEHPQFVQQFTKHADKKLAIVNQVGFFVQKFGGPEYYGGMVKESSFILDIHKEFFIPPSFLDIWMHHMTSALEEVDFGEQSKQVRDIILKWASQFGRATINAKEDEVLNNNGDEKE